MVEPILNCFYNGLSNDVKILRKQQGVKNDLKSSGSVHTTTYRGNHNRNKTNIVVITHRFTKSEVTEHNNRIFVVAQQKKTLKTTGCYKMCYA